MGLISWLFPTDEDRLASARALMERGKHDKARKLLVNCSLPEAEALYDECSAVVDKADRVTMTKRLVAEGFRGWKVEVEGGNARVKKELEGLVAKEIARAGINLSEAEVDEAAVKAAMARAQRRVTRTSTAASVAIRLVPIMAAGRRAQ